MASISDIAPYLIFVIGAPGSGKGTICSRLENDYGLYHLSVGDHLRLMARNHLYEENREFLQRHLEQAELVPTGLIMSNIKAFIGGLWNRKAILVDGFPREKGQALEFEKEVHSPYLVLSFECPEPIARERYLTRKLPGRLDDDEARFSKRISEFQAKNPEILEHYAASGQLVDTSTETERSYERLLELLKEDSRWKKIIGDKADNVKTETAGTL